MAKAPMIEVVHQIRRLVAPEQDRAASDRELLDRYASDRDEEAFAALLHRHGPMVLGVCRRELRCAQDAEDAFQATFLILARKAAAVHKREALASWLHGVAVRAARNLRREAFRRSAREAAVTDVPQPDAVNELTWREVQVALDEELVRLPERLRAPLVLCCLEGKSRDEAARQLGWTLGALKGRLERGRELLRARLTRRGVTLTGACAAATLVPDALAAVPASLTLATVTAMKLVAAGKAVSAGLVSARILALAEATAKSACLPNIRLSIVLVLALVLAGGGVGLVALGGREVEREADAIPKRLAAVGHLQKAPQGDEPIAGEPHDLLAAPARNDFQVPPVASWRLYTTLKGHGAQLHVIGFSPDGRIVAAGSEDGHIRGWDLVSGDESFSFQGPPRARVRSLVFAPDGKTLATGLADGSVMVWDVGRRIVARDAARGFARGVSTLTFAPGPGLLWARDGGAVEAEGRDGKPRLFLAGLPEAPGRCPPVRCTAFSPDGKTVAWGMEDGRVRLWDRDSRTERACFSIHQHQVWCVAFSPDGRVVASVDHHGAVKTWDPATGRELATTRHAGGGHVLTAAFSPDGSLLATGTGYHAVRIWEVKTGKEWTFQDHGGPVGCVAFSPDARFLASASTDGAVKLWSPVPAGGEDPAGKPGDRSPARSAAGAMWP